MNLVKVDASALVQTVQLALRQLRSDLSAARKQEDPDAVGRVLRSRDDCRRLLEAWRIQQPSAVLVDESTKTSDEFFAALPRPG